MGQLLGTLIRHAGPTSLAVARLPIAVIGTTFWALLVDAPRPLKRRASGMATARDAAVDSAVVVLAADSEDRLATRAIVESKIVHARSLERRVLGPLARRQAPSPSSRARGT
ncbi:MAG: hypothetical protein FJ298_15920 [Planctomycetes bacterium]|nr:hypothetical protein [Planctomycetota bacterium]